MAIEKPIGVKYSQAIKAIYPNWSGAVRGDTEDELEIDWQDEDVLSKSDIQAKITEIEKDETDAAKAKEDLKASAKAKLMAGETLTEDEANVMVGL